MVPIKSNTLRLAHELGICTSITNSTQEQHKVRYTVDFVPAHDKEGERKEDEWSPGEARHRECSGGGFSGEHGPERSDAGEPEILRGGDGCNAES